MRSRLVRAARMSSATSAGLMIRSARLAPLLLASLWTLIIEWQVPQIVSVAQERLDAQRVLARCRSAGTDRGRRNRIAHVFNHGRA
jgi:hypothetical protein